MAAPTKKRYGDLPANGLLLLILSSALFAVFQCSSAPAGSIPPFSSPQARYATGCSSNAFTSASFEELLSKMTSIFLSMNFGLVSKSSSRPGQLTCCTFPERSEEHTSELQSRRD